MAQYEDRLERDLNRLGRRVGTLGQASRDALAGAIQAFLGRDVNLANEVVVGDPEINRRAQHLDHLCHLFVARHLPSAGHLRFVSSVLRVGKTLERIGDYSETISRATARLEKSVPEEVASDVEMLGNHAQELLGQSLEHLGERNGEGARSTIAMCGQFGATFDKVFSDLTRVGRSGTHSVEDLFLLMATCNRLERIIHQAKNICQQTIFLATGETKEDKTYSVLFVDAEDSGLARLACASTAKGWPGAGEFVSASFSPGSPSDSFQGFAKERSLDIEGVPYLSFEQAVSRLSDFDIVLDLSSGGFPQQSQRLPFHTTLLTWKLEVEADPAAAYKDLSPRISQLMERLRGDDGEG